MALLVLIAIVLIALGHRIGPQRADTTPTVRLNAVIDLTGPDSIEQPVVARADGLSRIAVMTTGDPGMSDCALHAEIYDDTVLLSSKTVECRSLAINELHTIGTFSPIADSADRTFRVVLRSARPGADALRAWADATPDGASPTALVGGQPADLTLVTELRYGAAKPAYQQLGLMLDRLGMYGPPWRTGPVLIALLAVTLGTLALLAGLRGRAMTIGLITFVVFKGLVWATVVPPLEAPDEAPHFSYAQFIVEQKAVPRRYGTADGHSNAFSEQLTALNEHLRVDQHRPFDRPDYTSDAAAALRSELDHASPYASGSNGASGYPPVYYAPAAAVYAASPGDVLDKLFSVRLWSVALGALAAWLTLRFAQALKWSDTTALGLALAVSSQPVWSQQTATVNSDALIVVAGAASLLAMAVLIRPLNQRAPWVTCAAAASIGLGMLAKPYAASFAVPMTAAWLVGWLRTPEEHRRFAPEAGRALLGAGATYGTWLVAAKVFNYPSTSLSDIPVSDAPRSLGTLWLRMRENDFALLRQNWVEQLWYRVSALETRPPGPFRAMTLALMAGLILVPLLWVIKVLRSARSGGEADSGGRRVLADDTIVAPALVLLAIASAIGLLVAVGTQSFLTTAEWSLIQGRYALPVLPAILAVPVMIIPALRRSISAEVVAGTLASAMVLLNIATIAALLSRFYL